MRRYLYIFLQIKARLKGKSDLLRNMTYREISRKRELSKINQSINQSTLLKVRAANNREDKIQLNSENMLRLIAFHSVYKML